MLVLFLMATVWPLHAGPRKPADENELQYWLGNMLEHAFTMEEMQAASGLPFSEIAGALRRRDLEKRDSDGASALTVLPYPGGRHPRIGFLDGAIDPQRDTKISVFTPWEPRGYVVVDIPEAIWSNLGLTYLAHTHIDTIWDKAGAKLPKQEWERREDGSLKMARRLPNGISFGTLVYPAEDHVAMVMWLHNGTEATLSDLRVQNCVMLKAAPGFNAQTNDNKILADPFVACQSTGGDRWILTAWEPCHRPWANPPVPCLHSDPKFPDTAPSETTVLNGWLSFYEGQDVKQAMAAVEQVWHRRSLTDILEELPPDIR